MVVSIMQLNSNENTLIAKILGIVVATVIFAAILIPIVSEAAQPPKTYVIEENEGDRYFSTSPDIEITMSVSTPEGKETLAGTHSYTVNGTEYEVPDFCSVYMSTNVMFEFATGSDLYINANDNHLAYRTFNSTVSYVSHNGAYTLTITPTGEDAVVYTGTTSMEYYYTNDEGTYVQSNTFKANSDSKYLFNAGSFWTNSRANGVITDLTTGSMEISVLKYTEFTTYSETVNATLTWEVFSNPDGTYDITNFSCSDSTLIPAVNIYGLAPVEYKVYSDAPNMLSTLLSVLPILVLLAIILTVAKIMIVNKTD